MIELIQESYPNVGETQMRLLINNALDEFSIETKMLSGHGTFTPVADQREYALTALSTISDADDVLEIKKIDFKDNSESTDRPIPRFSGMIYNEDTT